jgi:hypothetical protein
MKRKLIAVTQALLLVLGLAAISGCGGDPYAYDPPGYGYAGNPYAYSTVPPVYEPRAYHYHYDEHPYQKPDRAADIHSAHQADHDRAVDRDHDHDDHH